MATLTATDVNQAGLVDVTVNTLVDGDDFLYKQGAKQRLHINNPTAGTIACTLKGDQATEKTCPTVGVPQDLSGGFSISLDAGESKEVNTQSISAWLDDANNLPSFTGGDGLELAILEG